jgi:hypothetical protein
VKSDALALKARMGFSREAFAMFMIMSVPLLAITMLGWFLFDKRVRKQLKEKAKRIKSMGKETETGTETDTETGKDMDKEMAKETTKKVEDMV